VLATRVAERAQFFKAIEQRDGSSADKALGLLRLLDRRMLPEGECEARAKALVSAYLKRVDFSASLSPEALPLKERQARTEEMKTLLETTGIRPKKEEEAEAESAA